MSRGPWAELNLATHVGDAPAAVATNRARAAREVGAAALHVVDQVHGADVHVVARAAVLQRESGTRAVADALATDVADVALAVLVADCIPVLLADPEAGVVAAAHAGRQGLVRGVLQAAVAAMAALGGSPGRTRAVLGPAIGGCCYEVPDTLRDEVGAVLPEAAATTRQGTPALDLPRAAAAVLRRSGVADVTELGMCTAEDERFFSYRRAGGAAHPTGRFAGVVVRSP